MGIASRGAAIAAATMVNTERFPLILYKRILRLHYGLPEELRYIGDNYVKDEFRRHKNAPPEQALLFLKEWAEYCMSLSKQLSNKGIAQGVLGKNLDPAMLDSFHDEQLRQLLDLKIEAEKPKISNA
uniref:Succinate dehydrogenase assembly factor 3 n=1 Tax=Ascaris lumbricoides TaxID=6252 RepID=A0A0M3I9K9_ASCLU